MPVNNRVVARRRLLVANRGEIATRIFRAATELNMQTVAIYSYEDRFSVHRFKADEAYQIGEEGNPLSSYLDWSALIKFAREKGIDCIHPGYGFLSENADFAEACERNGILFCGPPSRILKLFGDKLAAKKAALDAGLTPIPGSSGPVETLKEAIGLSHEFGFPITLKAVSGGGGKGIRIVENEAQLCEEFERARSEALSSFGQAQIYIEKTIIEPKHIEVQILADASGNVVHLFERDCSIQRRHQKVVEVAPAFGISEATKRQLYEDAVMIAKKVDFVGIGTIEFLVDKEENVFFLEVNPRVQVEHTVTEMITGIDIVQASIMLSAGRRLDHPAIGIEGQNQITSRGVAIQCRITTEDPQKNFAPDTGRILAYRPAQGFGIRLDEGLGTSGGLVTPYYDSLLVKVTAHSLDLYGASQKMRRALKEFRIRGVKHNIPLLLNIISHRSFVEGTFKTDFLSKNKEVFNFTQPRDRATKLLRYIGNVSVNNPHNLASVPGLVSSQASLPATNSLPKRINPTAKEVFEQGGATSLIEWIKKSEEVLLTDTTMRDAHQSLFATRLRTYDIEAIADFYNIYAADMFSLEVWGGATFDTSIRFLKEDPWERLALLREKIPRSLLQMLLRGDNAVGYSHYPEWVIRQFIKIARETGIDLFRIFDCLNNPGQQKIAIEEVLNQGGIAEACVCYTGNILDEKRPKYNLSYYLSIAKELERMGAQILAIKDMAGLLRPRAATMLIKTLKNEIALPIHLHTHATSGSSVATVIAAAEAGCDIIDGAISSMAGLTSQPSLNAIVASLDGGVRASKLPLRVLDQLSPYWETVRSFYKAFDPGINASSTRVYDHEIPGGQYSNLYDQARKVGLNSTEFYELTDRYAEVNQLLGDIVKVTPSSKVVGDLALLLQKNNLTTEALMNKRPALDYPDSTISFLKGHMGVPYGGFPNEFRSLVLGPNPPAPGKPPLDPEDTYEKAEFELCSLMNFKPTAKQVITYRLYPKVYKEFIEHKRTFGSVEKLPTLAFFYGLTPGQEIAVDIEPGKTLLISLTGISEPDAKGNRTIFFQLNGFPREISVADQSAINGDSTRLKADLTNPDHIPAPMPGKVVELKVKQGDEVKSGDVIIVTESMKMEYGIRAKTSGTVSEINAIIGDQVEEGDLLVRLTTQ